MEKNIQGVEFQRYEGYAVCHINEISDELKVIVREHLSSICHGSHVSDDLNSSMYNYKSTIGSFLERYKKKTDITKKGMIGEFLSHIIITSLFDEYVIASAFFNLEEKSIKKGFDLLLYDTTDSTVWITEVKSGNLHANSTHDQTTSNLLNQAKNDLNKRLNEQETQYWHNAIHHVRASVHDESDYRDALIRILRDDYGCDAATKKSKSQDKNVVLISNLFEPLSTKISITPSETLSKSLSDKKLFSESIVLTIQKATYEKIVEFLQSEIV